MMASVDAARPAGRPPASKRGHLTRRAFFLSSAWLALAACTDKDPEPRGRVSVVDHGAVGDGRTDDTAAIVAAVAEADRRGGATVTFPATSASYLCGPFAVGSRTTLRGTGGGATLVKRGGSAAWVSTRPGAEDVAISRLTLSCGPVRTTALIKVGTDTSGFRIEDCVLSSSLARRSIGLETRDGTRRIDIRRCRFDGLGAGVRLNKDPDGVVIEDCVFTNWVERGIQVLGTRTHAARSLEIRGNTIHPHAGDGDVRQPIQFNGHDDNPFSDVRVVHNRVRGLGTAYRDPARPGTADLISLHRCVSFEVRDNICTDGGDTGITVSQQSAHGVVVGNTCLRNNSSGIHIGSGTSEFTKHVRVADNTCLNNGQDMADYFPDRVRSGIRMHNVADARIVGNRVANTSGSTSQLYGLSMTDCARVRYADGNTLDANTVAAVLAENAPAP